MRTCPLMERAILKAIAGAAPTAPANCKVVVQSAQAPGKGFGGGAGGVTAFSGYQPSDFLRILMSSRLIFWFSVESGILKYSAASV